MRYIVLSGVFVISAACAAHQSSSSVDTLPRVTALGAASAISASSATPDDMQLRAAYRCVAEAIIEAGYPIRKDEQRLVVSGQVREEIGDQAVIDRVSAHVRVDDQTRRLRVDARSYTDVRASARTAFVRQGASPRGTLAVNHALGCANPRQSTE